MGKFIAGAFFGLVLSVAYVWHGVKLPDWIELPEVLQGSLKTAATDNALYDLNAPADRRRRALEVYFANQAERASQIDQSLAHPILNELMRRRVKRRAQVLRGLWSAYDQALNKPALRKVLVKKHCLLYTSPSPRDRQKSRMPSSA